MFEFDIDGVFGFQLLTYAKTCPIYRYLIIRWQLLTSMYFTAKKEHVIVDNNSVDLMNPIQISIE